MLDDSLNRVLERLAVGCGVKLALLGQQQKFCDPEAESLLNVDEDDTQIRAMTIVPVHSSMKITVISINEGLCRGREGDLKPEAINE